MIYMVVTATVAAPAANVVKLVPKVPQAHKGHKVFEGKKVPMGNKEKMVVTAAMEKMVVTDATDVMECATVNAKSPKSATMIVHQVMIAHLVVAATVAKLVPKGNREHKVLKEKKGKQEHKALKGKQEH